MISGRLICGIALGALVAAGIAVAPAIGANQNFAAPAAPRASAASLADVDSFTPASADPRLAAVFARAGLDSAGFRFTPAESRRAGGHAVTVAVRARSTRNVLAAEQTIASPPANTVSLAPIAYNLGVAVGWRRFALSGDVAKVDLAGLPGSRQAMDVGVSYTGRRFGAQVKAMADRPLANTPPLVADPQSYLLDVGGSYSLSQRLDVTAGLRYKTERSRLPELTDARRDSQAVYIGTAFRF